MDGTFGANSTTDEVLAGVNLRDKRALVTGVSSGLGVETARALVAAGADVLGTARDLEKAHRACEPVYAAGQAGGGTFEIVELELADLRSVRNCADTLLADGRRFDILIANAGVMAPPFGKTVDGFETQFGTCHIGHFVFINRIAALLNPGARVVMLSSSGHRFSDVNLDDPNFERTEYTPFGAYGRAKTANALFAVEFDRRHREQGICATAIHPGVIQTELSRHMSPEVIAERRAAMTKSNPEGQAPQIRMKSVPQGAATSVWAAVVAPADAVGAHYCEDCQVAVINDDPAARSGVRSYALDPQNAAALWAKSEEMVGEQF